MTWTIDWSFKTREDRLGMHYETTWRIVQAVLAFAEAGADSFDLVNEDDDPSLFRVRAEDGFALVRIDEISETITISRLVADRPLPHRVAFLDEPDPPDE